MGVKAGSALRSDVLLGELDDATFAADFGKLARGEESHTYRGPGAVPRRATGMAAAER